jgi:hypothetical protein
VTDRVLYQDWVDASGAQGARQSVPEIVPITDLHTDRRCRWVEVAPTTVVMVDRCSGYAVMTRIRVGDSWTWTTWMQFETYLEAAAHARDRNKVVRFRSSEWAALPEQAEAASPIVIKVPRESITTE